jgi:selenoprotein W-related protein
LAAEILSHFKQDVEELVLVPSTGGRFEVFLDRTQIYSKLETGSFPEARDIVRALEAAG